MGFLPPSSRVTCLIPAWAANCMIVWPVATLPVKATRRMLGCSTRARPTTPPGPVSTVTTPGGTRSAASSPMRKADNGV